MPRKGAVRRAQMITTYESFIVAGIDTWDITNAPEIHEHRLARYLGVRSFRLPPASDENSRDGVHVRRFPLWHSCPDCNVLQPVGKFNSAPGTNECGDCKEDLVPSRFVVACSHGHLDDFPYWKWVHRNNRDDGATGACGGTLKLTTNGRTASLRSILISCTCGVPEVSMEGAFRSSALTNLRVRCEGRRPWLRNAPAEKSCTETPRTLQRGSSMAWQPIVRSALSIPPWSDGLAALLAPHLDDLRECESDSELARAVKFITKSDSTPLEAVRDLLKADQAELADIGEEPTHDTHRLALLEQEYRKLRAGSHEADSSHGEEFICEKPQSTSPVLDGTGIVGPMLVKRLREVRALTSFTRVISPDSALDGQINEAEADIAMTPQNWLPAMEVRGEGVFFRIDEQRLDAWAAHPGVIHRVDRIRHNHELLLRERAADPQHVPPSPATPRLVMLHTLAHILINEWSLDSGYPAASLRERLYAENTEMAGVLIYTATSDSAGSLGGLVAQGEPAHLAEALRSAVRRAEWCSADPLCIESEVSGAGSINLAACHACVLLPETSCERNNTLLDRALLVGTPEEPSIGFFHGLTGN
jgi:hypothetical protein